MYTKDVCNGNNVRKNMHKTLMHKVLFLVLMIMFIALMLSACDENDPMQPTSDVLLVLNNGEENVKWSVGQEVPAPTKDGHVFLYWCEDIECEIKSEFTFDSMPSESLVLYAKWAELAEIEGVIFADKTVTYDGNAHTIEASGIPSGATVSYEGGDKVAAGEYVVSAMICKDGYKSLELTATLTIQKASVGNIVFEDCSVDWDGKEHSIYISTPLPNGVTVSYDGNNQIDAGKHTVTATFDTGNNYEQISSISAVLTIKEKLYTLVFNDGTISTEIKVAHGKDAKDIPAVTPKRGYDGKWSEEDLTCITDDMSITAVYTLTKYTVTYEVNGGDEIECEQYTMQDGYAFKEPSRDYYEFGGWYTDAVFDSPVEENIAVGEIGDVTVYACWIPIVYTVTYHLNGGINDYTNEKHAEYTVESEAYEYASPIKDESAFDGWYDNPDFTGDPITMREAGIHGDIDLYAKWINE